MQVTARPNGVAAKTCLLQPPLPRPPAKSRSPAVKCEALPLPAAVKKAPRPAPATGAGAAKSQNETAGIAECAQASEQRWQGWRAAGTSKVLRSAV